MNIKDQVRRKRFLIDSFLFTINLDLPFGPDDIKYADAVLKRAATAHFLRAIILELIIKIQFELDNNKKAPFIHDLEELYSCLEEDTQKMLTDNYDEARERYRKWFVAAEIEDVHFHPLEKVLANNKTTVVHFKYDAMAVDSNDVIDEAFCSAVFKHVDKRLGELDV
jgi:hypothetical protein